jgi:hypothetical protein
MKTILIVINSCGCGWVGGWMDGWMRYDMDNLEVSVFEGHYIYYGMSKNRDICMRDASSGDKMVRR